MSRCAQSRSVNLAARRASQRRMRSRLRSATCSPVAACRQHARSRHACCDMRAMCIPASHACIGRARRHHDTRRLARQAPRIAHVERAGRLPRLDPTLFGSIRLYSARIKSTRIEPAAHAAGSRRSSIPHPSLHASATAPRIAPPAAVNPHRNCGDTRPDSSPRCA